MQGRTSIIDEPIQQLIDLINDMECLHMEDELVPIPHKNSLKPIELLRNDNSYFQAYQAYPSANEVEKAQTKLLPMDIRTLVFKPWSGIATHNENEYNTIKEENQPEDQIKEQDNEDDGEEQAKSIAQVIPATQSPAQSGYFYRFQSGYVKLIRELLEQNGFRDVPANSHNWTLHWSCTPYKLQIYDRLLPYQKINHFPNSFQVTRKDLMNKNISKMQIRHGYNNFNFLPRTFILPQETQQLEEDFKRTKKIYIVKPHNRSQGKGIIVTDDLEIILSRLDKYSSLVVSQYIDNPLLINGFKFDLRIYVGITSVCPLRIYIYEEGLARFATELYSSDMSSEKKAYRHLTNYSVNKKNENFVPSSTGQDDYYGSKWSLTALRDFLEFNVGKAETCQLFDRIDELVIKTILSIENILYTSFTTHVPYINNCFEVLGFDVLIDSTLKPWLVEVNHSPSMNTDSPLDLKIKGNMVADMFTMIGIVPQSQRYSGSNFTRYETARYLHLKNQPGRQESQIDKFLIRQAQLEEKRSGRWRKVFPLANNFRYRQFFQVDRYVNAVLRQSFLHRTTVLTQKSSVSTAISNVRSTSKPKSRNIRVVKRREIKTYKRL